MNKRKYITIKVKELGRKYNMNDWAMERIVNRIVQSTNITISEVTTVIKVLIDEELRRHRTA